MTIRNVQVRNPWFSQNGDGLDIDSCRHVLVEQSVFDVGDDAICLKSGKDAEGRELGMPSEYITVRDCTVYHGHGGVVIGSEMSGGIRHVRVSDCTFIGTDIGLRFKSARGRGGVVEDIQIERIYMKDIIWEGISFSFFYANQEGSARGSDLAQEVSEETPFSVTFTFGKWSVQARKRRCLSAGCPKCRWKDWSSKITRYSPDPEYSAPMPNICELRGWRPTLPKVP